MNQIVRVRPTGLATPALPRCAHRWLPVDRIGVPGQRGSKRHAKSSVLLLLAMCAASGLPQLRAQAKHIAQRTNDDGWVDVSGTLGFPMGGLGTGYSAFGPFGFVHVNFDGRANDGLHGLSTGQWEYTAAAARASAEHNVADTEHRLHAAQAAGKPPATLQHLRQDAQAAQDLLQQDASPAGFAPTRFGFVLREGKTARVLQTTAAPWVHAESFPHATARVFLPQGQVRFVDEKSGTEVQVDAFTPLLPHDLATSAIPVQVFDVTVRNRTVHPRSLSLALDNAVPGLPLAGQPGAIVFHSDTGEMSFAAEGGALTQTGVGVPLNVPANGTGHARFYIAWYYPAVGGFKRYYTRDFHGTADVLRAAFTHADTWSRQIDAWHASMDVPASLKRLWFGSLSPVETSIILTADPLFLEVETPHNFYNTMDVFVYANWVYMINWPELERMDMDQFLATVPKTGANAGAVLHSIWKDSADYAEEPTLLVRVRRDALWYNDPAWTRSTYTTALLAANHVYGLDHQDGLLVSKQGNQSYDVWKMPGISSYVNSAWLYGLNSLQATSRSLGGPAPTIAGEPLTQFLPEAQASYDHYLWNARHCDWDVFYRTPGADAGSIPDSLFTDQLFGRWVTAIDPAAQTVLPDAKVRAALLSLYRNNAVDDPSIHFRGWVDGMQAGHVPDVSGRHSRTFWIGPQINLASLLGLEGEEAASIDVIESVERSLGSDVLAAGEWNKSLDASGTVGLLQDEPAKDTPRFAPYPRYSSAWEYLVRIVGLQMDERHLFLKPFHTFDFKLENVELAGTTLSIEVQKNWTHARVDEKPAALPLTLDRSIPAHRIQFLR